VVIATTTGLLRMEWDKVPADARARLYDEHFAQVERANGREPNQATAEKQQAARPKPSQAEEDDAAGKAILRAAYLRRIEALRRERDALSVLAPRDPAGRQYKSARSAAIAAEISEKEKEIDVIDGRTGYKLRKITVGTPR